MKYIAHAAVKLKCGVIENISDEWNYIKSIDAIEYRWRLGKSGTCEVTAGLFGDKSRALVCAKTMYITLLYSLLKDGFSLTDAGCESYETRFFQKERDIDYYSFVENENFFFWDKHFLGGLCGPGVYVVENTFKEFEEFKFLSGSLALLNTIELSFDNIDEHIFVYNRTAQELMSSVVVADNEIDYGMKMTIYCGILEHLSDNGKKSEAVQLEIDNLIKSVKESHLMQDEKNQLVNYLNLGKELSARQRCKKLIVEYAATQYGQYLAKDILDEAYSIRSEFSHGSNNYSNRLRCSRYMKYLVLDVIKGYMQELERTNDLLPL